MKIVISSIHGAGKTTLVNALAVDPDFADYTCLTNLTRNLQNQGIPINEQGTAYTQMMVMLEHYRRVVLPGNHILDRCVIDGLVYSDVLLPPKKFINEFNVIDQLFDRCIYEYDYIFYIKPEFPLVDDGTRSVDIKFYNKINKSFKEIIKNLQSAGTVIHTITGTVENRVQQIKDIVLK